MSDHEEIRNLLSLAAAGVLEEAEEQRVAAHAARCTECAAELEGWQALAGGLRRLPTPQAPAALVERVRARGAAELAEHAEPQPIQALVACAVLAAWLLAVVSWPAVRWLGESFIRVEFNWWWVLGSASLAWLCAGLTGIALTVRQRMERRTA
jgi:anti-sigma factor RsiW